MSAGPLPTPKKAEQPKKADESKKTDESKSLTLGPFALGKLIDKYGHVPPPGSKTFEAVKNASEVLAKYSQAAGVIAVGLSEAGYWYLGCSDQLWKDLGGGSGDWAQDLQIADNVEAAVLTKLGRVRVGYSHHPLHKDGNWCAEKRVLGWADQQGQRIKELSITEHPIGSNPGTLVSHLALAGEDSYYAPCDTCDKFAAALRYVKKARKQ
jgi:hypothetical protein